MKTNKRRTVAYSFAYSCVLASVLLRFCGFRSSTQKKLNRFNFLRTLWRTVCKKYVYSCVFVRTVVDSCVLSTQLTQLYATLVEKLLQLKKSIVTY